MEEPKVIFFDAVGTLFTVRGSVGEIYSAIAQKHGVDVPVEALNEAFKQTFSASRSPVFSGVDSQQIPEEEFKWWQRIVKTTFDKVGVLEQISDFKGFYTQLYAHFATPKPWYVYPDVIPALKYWQQKGIELGIISNFDSRLYALIVLLGLDQFFSRENITISSTVGAAKPDSKIFLTALEKHNYTAKEAWYIGDNLKEDYDGAKNAGFRAFLLQRSNSLI